eukprot:TRINITY_DN9692_c0_g1_i1.p1 TRINITY_DN9692_c0_g1~~TRINITY_DN9692_c0_g1_i1.p1  ORF type:complete len:343 (+),score=82.89 TRINITY_DN9692_c0_g1_i1:187-1215(+)
MASILCVLIFCVFLLVRSSLPSEVHCDVSGCTDSQDFLPWSNLTHLAALEQTESFTMKVFVLTMNRPESLTRLLNSISDTFFEYAGDKIELEIHVDKSHGLLYEECVKIAQNYTLPPGRGTVTAKIAKENHGLRAAWFDCWSPKTDTEHAIIVEDDLELAPTWLSWLRKAWLSYRHREDVAGITLSRQFLMFKKPERADLEIINDHFPFLYKLVGTWAFSPHPKKWREFLAWFNSLDSEAFDPYVPGLVTSDWLHIHTWQGRRHMTWEQWHIYYGEQHGLYTMYINLPKQEVLANHWREAGVHSRVSAGRPDYRLAQGCPIQLQDFPDRLRRYDWDTSEIVT